jgi:hypothetical protein
MQQLPLLTIESVDEGIAGIDNRATNGLAWAGVWAACRSVVKAKAVEAGIHNLIATWKHRALYHFGLGVSGGEAGEVVGDGGMGVARTR